MKIGTLVIALTFAASLGWFLIEFTLHFYAKEDEYSSSTANADGLLAWCDNRSGMYISPDDLESMENNAKVKKISPDLYTFETIQESKKRTLLRGRIIFDSKNQLVGCTVDEEVGWR